MGWNDISTAYTGRHWASESTEHESEAAKSPADQQRRNVAEQIAGPITWYSLTSGRTKCPLGHDCQVHIDDHPTPLFHCLHDRCKDELGEWNRELQAGCQRLQAVGKRARLTPEERERLKSAKRLRLLEARTKQFILPELLKQVEIDPASWLIQSPFRIPEDCREHWKPLLSGLFKPKDTIWCGYLEDSGDRLHTTRFKHVEDWMQCTHHPGPQTCPGVFFEVTAHKGERIFSRSKDLVRLRPYWVAESDLLAKAQFGIIIQHLRQQLFLRAIVDTGGKSLHAWFDAPHLYQIGRDKLDPKIERRMEELQSVMCGLGCDPHMFNLNSTTRLPGCLRLDEETGQARGWQRLLYLDPKHEPCTGLT